MPSQPVEPFPARGHKCPRKHRPFGRKGYLLGQRLEHYVLKNILRRMGIAHHDPCRRAHAMARVHERLDDVLFREGHGVE